MALKMNLKFTGQLGELIRRHPCLSALRDKAVWEYETDALRDYFAGGRTADPRSDTYRWNVPDISFFDHQREVSVLPVMFIGKTGYGKSSLLNRIIGTDVFPTDDIRSCTNEIDAAFFRLGRSPLHYLSLSDLPGIGESEQADRRYMEWYTGLLQCSPSVVYVLRADQRDFSTDERAFRTLFRREEELDKIVIALNCADKINPVSRSSTISEAQLEALEKKVELIERQFSIPSYRIIPCCAHTGYGVDGLVSEIAEDLEMCVFDED